MDDGGTRILAEGEDTLGCDFRIAEEREGYVLVVVACFGVAEDFSHLFVVRAAQHEGDVAEGSISHRRQTLFSHFQNRFSLELRNRDIVFSKQIILSRVGTMLEHRLIVE